MARSVDRVKACSPFSRVAMRHAQRARRVVIRHAWIAQAIEMVAGTFFGMRAPLMITKAALVAWGLAASLVASNGARRLSSTLLEAMADAALANPVTSGDEGTRVTMAYEVAIAWFESGNLGGAIGDGHSSYCWGQIYLPNGARTREGYSGDDLVSDAMKCATVVVRLVKMSIQAGPPDCTLCFYARGRVSDEARRMSQHRVDLVKKLLDMVPAP
jgi:hypothetical protein